MSRILCITGTGTEIGKTGLSLSVLLWARSKGLKVGYLKPVQCGSREGAPPVYTLGANTFFGDSEWIQAAIPGEVSDAAAVYTFADPVSPHLAAERAGVWIDPEWILEQVEVASRRCDLLVIEGAGGAAVPFNRDGLCLADLAAQGQWPCLLASQPGLGTLHHTLTTAHYMRSREARIAGFAMIQSAPSASPVQADNIATLKAMLDLPFFGLMPHCPGLGRRLPLSPAVAALLAQSLPGLETWWAA
jgi:dethiobiotin synthetase